MIAPLLITAQLGQVPPQLDLLTPPQAGTTLVYQMTGNLTGPGVPEFLLLDFQLLPIPLELPPFGVLQLAITPLLQILVGDGSGFFLVPVPANPNFAGVVVHAQGFGFVFDLQAGSNRFTNLVSATLTAPDPQPRFLFAANSGDASLSRFVIDADGGKLRPAGVRIVGGPPLDLAATPAGNYLFVLTPDAIEPYAVDPVSGALAPVAAAVQLAPAVDPGRLALSPDGQRLYLSDRAQDRILGYSIGSSGALTALPNSPWTVVGSGGGPQGPEALAIDEQGRFLCVLNATADSLSVFDIGPAGGLSSEVVTSLDAEPSALAVLYQDTAQPRVVVTSRGADTVTVLQLGADGSATIVGQSALAVGADPGAVAVERFSGGDRVYVANTGTDGVDALLLAPSGQLSVPVPTVQGGGPVDLAFARSADRAYVLYADDHELSTLAVDPTDGGLSPYEPVESPTDRIRVRQAPSVVELVNGSGFATIVTDRAYVAAREGREVGQFDFEPSLSALLPLNPDSANTVGKPNELAVHPSLEFLYVANFLDPGASDLQVYDLSIQGKAVPIQSLDLEQPGESRVWTVDVDATGSLVIASLATVPGRVVPLRVGPGGNLVPLVAQNAGDVPRGAAIDPTGRFYYVANSLSASISQYRVDAAQGSLTPLTPPTVPSGNGPFDVVCDPNGRFAYAVNSGSGTVTSYRIDGATGALTPLASGPTPAGSGPIAAAIHPGGRYLVVADQVGRTLLQYRINLDGSNAIEDGSLVPLGQLLVGDRPLGLRFTADGEHLLVALDAAQAADHLDTFAFDPTTGALSFLEKDTVGAEPRGVATRDRIE